MTVALTAVFIGIVAVSATDSKNRPDHYSHTDFTGGRTWRVKVHEVLKSTTYSDRYIAQVIALGKSKKSGEILLSLSSDAAAERFKVDDELIVYTNISPINAPLNPHQFDYRDYMKSLGIAHRMRLSAENFVMVKNPERSVYGMAAMARHRIIGKLREADFGKEELGIIQALLLGRRNDISSETYDNYKNAGAVHILAVSGLHIGILLLLLQFLLRPLERWPRGKTIKLVLIVALLWGFAFLAGLSASVVRAVTMFSFVAYALFLNRPGNTFNILALSMFFILLAINPLLLFQVGFQMSYAAVFAIVWIYPLLQGFWNPKNRIVRYFWQLLSVSIAAQVGVLPISLFYFHQFPGLFFISNLLIVPALGLILGMGILVIFLALLNRLPEFLVSIYDTLIGCMNHIIGWVAHQEAFVFRNISFDGVQLVLAYAILFCLVLFLSGPNFKKAVALALTVIGFQLWLFHTSIQTYQKEALFVAHQTRNSVLMHQQGSHLSAFAQDTHRLERITADYRIAERIASIGYPSLQNTYRWRDKSVLVIDSLGIYPKKPSHTDYLLLTGSPQLNLERLIDSIHPKIIIADGSNYRSYVARWEETSQNQGLPFHYTGEKGAYYFQ
jgi:competence protein ComEC